MYFFDEMRRDKEVLGDFLREIFRQAQNYALFASEMMKKKIGFFIKLLEHVCEGHRHLYKFRAVFLSKKPQ